MKKQLFYLLALSCAMCFVSCDKDKDKIKKEEVPQEEIKENLSIIRQQALIEQSIIDFTNTIPASDFEELRAFINEVDGIADSMDFKNVHLDDTLKQIIKTKKDSSYVIPREKLKKDEDRRALCVISSDTISIIEKCYMLSNLTGHFAATDTMTWVYTPAEDLQFIFKDSLKNNCVLSLVHSGKEVKVKAPYTMKSLGNTDRVQKANGDTIYYIDRHEMKETSMVIPEKLTLSLSRNDTTAATATISTTFKNLSDGYFDVGVSGMGIETTFESSNGFKLVTSGEYDANKAISMTFAISKGGKNALSFNLSAEPEGVASFELKDDKESQLLIDSTKNYTDSVNTKKLLLSLSFMDEVKIEGSVSDIRKFRELNDSIKKLYAMETAYKSVIEQMNESLDFHVSFEGYKEAQAKLVIEPECKVIYENGLYIDKWSHNYVMVLADGSKASVGKFMDVEQYEVGYLAMIRLGVQYGRMIKTGEANTEKNYVNRIITSIAKALGNGVRTLTGLISQLGSEYKDELSIK